MFIHLCAFLIIQFFSLSVISLATLNLHHYVEIQILVGFDGMVAFSKSDLLTVLSRKSEANVMNPKVLRSTKLHKPNFFDDYGILFIFINRISKKYK